ncbi:right-handed parallel beta-helix repeat-containing protein [Streptomyces sp. M19]
MTPRSPARRFRVRPPPGGFPGRATRRTARTGQPDRGIRPEAQKAPALAGADQNRPRVRRHPLRVAARRDDRRARAAAHGAACTGQVRYASSTNTIYLTSGTATLPGVRELCPSAPISRTDAASRTWELSADLVVQNGATLELHGSRAGGDVDTLRLRSLSDNRSEHVSAITAQYGTIDIDSWPSPPGTTPPAAGHRPGLPRRHRPGAWPPSSGPCPTWTTTAPARVPDERQDSDIGYLGYYAAESYGIAYKSRGCDSSHQDVCDVLDVYGDQTGSRFHHNYMGTYTFDAHGMTFDRNEYDHNISYGLDPHDDSDHLTITRNHAHHNGNHGFICSQRCDHLRIVGNEVTTTASRRTSRRATTTRRTTRCTASCCTAVSPTASWRTTTSTTNPTARASRSSTAATTSSGATP